MRRRACPRLPPRGFARSGRRTRALGLLLAWLSASCAAGCATPVNSAYERRIADSQRGLDGDLAVEARREEVEAAMARERGESVLDAVQLRVRDEYEDHHRVRVTARIPVPDPWEIRARRELRRADTETSVARLEETALSRRAELCFLSIEAAAYRERTEIYKAYARWQRTLQEWNKELQRSGSQSESAGTRFELESRIKLATRMPGPAPETRAPVRGLPPLERWPGRVVRSPALVREIVREHNPSVAVHEAISERYRALSARAESQRWPWLDFVDLSTQFERHRDTEFGTQIALRVPLGAATSAEVDRYRALGRSQTREGDAVVEEQMRRSLFALRELDHFETNTDPWNELLTLARRAEAVAEQGWKERLARPSQIATLIEQAYDARNAVLDARERAGMASCTLLALTSISLDVWPRE